jgi:mono/diheme cytochrome c family protein
MWRTLLPLFVTAAVLTFTKGLRAAEAPRRTPELVAKGKAAFVEYCATCHGLTGEGDGPASETLKPPPRNLATAPPKGGARAVFRVLNTGVEGTAMFAFTHLPEEERWAIAYFVESLARTKK